MQLVEYSERSISRNNTGLVAPPDQLRPLLQPMKIISSEISVHPSKEQKCNKHRDNYETFGFKVP
ncbi:hypothetical protein K0M31_014274 [Melipona bicolor]|uniref:Uncharacterized protein n=1 Tax=Melipona bicolor TaxID=60889 RepID=A0AA40G9E8_9HYME|nr:hypothetical protein K0M31_014274 [Melipona bicolor]